MAWKFAYNFVSIWNLDPFLGDQVSQPGDPAVTGPGVAVQTQRTSWNQNVGDAFAQGAQVVVSQ